MCRLRCFIPLLLLLAIIIVLPRAYGGSEISSTTGDSTFDQWLQQSSGTEVDLPTDSLEVLQSHGAEALRADAWLQTVLAEHDEKVAAGRPLQQDLQTMPDVAVLDEVAKTQSSVCAEGGCEAQLTLGDSQFAASVSMFAGQQASAASLTEVRVFPGKALSCRDKWMGFANCCQDHGWGLDAHLTGCRASEKALGRAKQSGRAVYLGRVCAHEGHGVLHKYCQEYKKVYCVFNDKLAKIVQVQGRQGQLHEGFGGAKVPDCRGVTADALQRLDFGKMDFTEYYAELPQPTSLSMTGEELGQKIQRLST